MKDIQRVEGLASRESLPVGALIELLFGESVDTLKELRLAYGLYPNLTPKDGKRIIQAYENFSMWVIALIHPNPGNRASLSDILDLQISTQDVYSWLSKNQKNLSLRSQAKLFINTFEEIRSKGKQPLTRREKQKLKIQSRNESWHKAYLELKKKHPKRSDAWYSQKIENMEIAQGKSSETIRKIMKK